MSSTNSILWSDFTKLKIPQQKIGELFIKPVFKVERGLTKGRLSELINGKNYGKSYDILELLGRTTRDPESGQKYTCENDPYLTDGKKIWDEYLVRNPDKLRDLEELVSRLCGRDYDVRLPEEDGSRSIDLSEKLKEMEADGEHFSLAYRLSVLSILASTWPFWEALRTGDYHEKEKVQTDSLLRSAFSMIFPVSGNSADADDIDVPAEHPVSCDELYQVAVSLYEKGEYLEAAPLFTRIVQEYLNAPYKILADSYSKLLKCYSSCCGPVARIGTKEELERWALFYGAKDVPVKARRIHCSPEPSLESGSGLCVFIDPDKLAGTRQILNRINGSMPVGWLTETLGDFGTPEETADRIKGLLYKKDHRIRFILINSEPVRNLDNALVILETIRVLQESGESSDFYRNDEIIIRCPEEIASSLLDTACSFLDEHEPPVKIFIIDEKKRPADDLFSRHPLFYPLTFSFNRDRADTASVNLMIVSDNPDIEYVCYLVRDAFWMLPHSTRREPSKITILSPYASETARRLVSICPGFSAFTSIVKPGTDVGEPWPSPEQISIEDLSFPRLEYHPMAADTRAFQSRVADLTSGNALPYFVVDSSSDLHAIEMGKSIREGLIRRAIKTNRLKRYSSDASVVAVRIQDPDLAGLAENLIVPKEAEHDERWFNDFKLITFGSTRDLYSWDQLTGGPVEFASLCMHLQYSGQDGIHDFTKAPSSEQLWSYYYRLYNRASSYAEAMSLPYRLFESGVVPSVWHISNRDAYWGEANRELLAAAFEEKLKESDAGPSDLPERLARYEHARWCCYMLSMGWLPATEKQTEYFIRNGVTRHALQIAKLHPCICAWEDLKQLSRDLKFCYDGDGATDVYGKPVTHEEFQYYKNYNVETFQTIDIKNIRQTGDLLRAKPLRERVPERDMERF